MSAIDAIVAAVGSVVSAVIDRYSAAQLRERCENDPNALHIAVTWGHTDEIKFLLGNGRSAHETNSSGQTALSQAVQLGRSKVVQELLSNGALVDAEDSDGSTPLFRAAQLGDVQVTQILIESGADVNAKDNEERTALWYAAASEREGSARVIRELIKHGAVVDSRDKLGRTTLSRAACAGYTIVVQELIKHGAVIDSADRFGRTALSHAAIFGGANTIRELIRHSAAVSTKDSFGRTALSHAAENGHAEVAEELAKSGANVAACDQFGRTVLSWAIKDANVVYAVIKGTVAAKFKCHFGSLSTFTLRIVTTAILYQERGRDREWWWLVYVDAAVFISAIIPAILCVFSLLPLWGGLLVAPLRTLYSALSRSADLVALFDSVAVNDIQAVQKLIANGPAAILEATTDDGRTPLFFAAEFGHTDIVRLLIKSGTSVTARSHSRLSPRESETSLILAGREGNMQAFRALIEAGAPVNVRSGEDGETPLVSAARWDYFAGVQLLISRGGCVRFDAVAEDEYPLILGTLQTMEKLCGDTFEFEPMCSHFWKRLRAVCDHLQASPDSIDVQKGNFVSFASVIFRFCRLLLDIKKRRDLLSRFIVSRVLASKIQDHHSELDYFNNLLTSTHAGNWREQFEDDVSFLQPHLEALLSAEEDLMFNKCAKETEKFETAVLLQHELSIRGKEGRHDLHETIKRVLARFLYDCCIEAPVVPEWFISRTDVEYHKWNAVMSEKGVEYYEGKWRETRVMIETSSFTLDEFSQAVAQWYQLSHPHIVKLFGACHVEKPRFSVCESVAQGKPLHHFLSVELNRDSMWKCLYEAALGLQYLHNRGAVFRDLRSENIMVGSDLVTKLSGMCKNPNRFAAGERSGLHWTAPELVSQEAPVSLASDVYAFGMCIWEAVARELPWRDASSYDINYRLRSRNLPERPARMDDSQWDLITKMCAADPRKRVDIAYVVNRLSKFLFQSKLNPSHSSDTPKSINEHVFPKLGDTIPNTLRNIRLKCGQFPNEKWMISNVFPALKFIFVLLQEQRKSSGDIEVVQFCATLCQFQRHLRTTLSEESARRNARSREVAETHHVTYSELDRLLDTLDVSKTNRIRVWTKERQPDVMKRQPTRGAKGATSSSHLKKVNKGSLDVKLMHFETPTSSFDRLARKVHVVPTAPKAWFTSLREQWLGKRQPEAPVSKPNLETLASSHRFWTVADLMCSASHPPWYISVRELMLNEWDAIGKGAFGSVCTGFWLGTPVVVKIMGYEEDVNTISTDLLLHEVRVWHRLHHPHVLKFYGACHVAKRYFVCEHASNGELLKYLKKPGNDTLLWQKMYEAALGLQYIHGQNVAHNDLKCDNIVVGMDGNAKLIDFGLSGLLGEAEIQIDVKEMGAVNWRSPEYLAGDRPSFASDVYSFAMCIIEAVSGDVPWGNKMLPAVLRFHWKRGNGPQLPDSMTEKQKHLVRLMTEVDPSERVKMAFVVDKLNEIAQDQNAKKAPP